MENLERMTSKDTLAAALAYAVARFTLSLSFSATSPYPANEKLARTKVKEWRGRHKVGTIKT